VGEPVQLKVELIVTRETPAAQATKQATATIPIVFFQAGDPVQSGLVTSLARQGGNITGVTAGNYEGKQLEVLKEAIPRLSRFAYLRDANYPPGPRNWEPASRMLRVTAQALEIWGPDDLDGAFAAATRGAPEPFL
jgi:ABC-type uncharacterized transport system substrate-binding protein